MKPTRVIVPVVALSIFIGLTSAAVARPVKIWSFQELTEKADLVIIGTATATTDAKNQVSPNAQATTVVDVNTTFDVQGVLKGELKSNSVKVRHRRYLSPDAEHSVVDGPAFVEFNPKRKSRYLMYLKRTDEGEYEPLTGQYDPWTSFFLLEDYHVSREKEGSKNAADR